MVAIFVLVVTSLAAGAAAGMVAVIALGIRREERMSTMTTGTQDQLCLGTRWLTGLHVCMPQATSDRSRG
jgi:hypothetical protein